MSYLKLFRKEALKHQYKSHEFGQSVIEQPRALNSLLVLLFVMLGLFALLVVSYPVVSTQSYPLSIQDGNYHPLISSTPVILEKHLHPDGMAVNVHQPLTQIRFFHHSSKEEISKVLQSQQAGYYFGSQGEGSVVKAYQPIGKILLPNHKHLYFFKLKSHNLELNSGQKVTIQTGNISATGVIDSVQGPYPKDSYRIGVRIQAPYDINLLNPSVMATLTLTLEQDNILGFL